MSENQVAEGRMRPSLPIGTFARNPTRGHLGRWRRIAGQVQADEGTADADHYCIDLNLSPGLKRMRTRQLRKNEAGMTMKEATSVTKDPVCGMTVDQATAIHAERAGKTFYFCSEHCRAKFLSTMAGTKPEDKSGGCCS